MAKAKSVKAQTLNEYLDLLGGRMAETLASTGGLLSAVAEVISTTAYSPKIEDVQVLAIQTPIPDAFPFSRLEEQVILDQGRESERFGSEAPEAVKTASRTATVNSTLALTTGVRNLMDSKVLGLARSEPTAANVQASFVTLQKLGALLYFVVNYINHLLTIEPEMTAQEWAALREAIFKVHMGYKNYADALRGNWRAKLIQVSHENEGLDRRIMAAYQAEIEVRLTDIMAADQRLLETVKKVDVVPATRGQPVVRAQFFSSDILLDGGKRWETSVAARPVVKEKPSTAFAKLGMKISANTVYEAGKMVSKPGARVDAVESNSPAASARLRQGDVIIELNNTFIRTPEQFRDAFNRIGEGVRTSLSVIHDGREVTRYIGVGIAAQVPAEMKAKNFNERQLERYRQAVLMACAVAAQVLGPFWSTHGRHGEMASSREAKQLLGGKAMRQWQFELGSNLWHEWVQSYLDPHGVNQAEELPADLILLDDSGNVMGLSVNFERLGIFSGPEMGLDPQSQRVRVRRRDRRTAADDVTRSPRDILQDQLHITALEKGGAVQEYKRNIAGTSELFEESSSSAGSIHPMTAEERLVLGEDETEVGIGSHFYGSDRPSLPREARSRLREILPTLTPQQQNFLYLHLGEGENGQGHVPQGYEKKLLGRLHNAEGDALPKTSKAYENLFGVRYNRPRSTSGAQKRVMGGAFLPEAIQMAGFTDRYHGSLNPSPVLGPRRVLYCSEWQTDARGQKVCPTEINSGITVPAPSGKAEPGKLTMRFIDESQQDAAGVPLAIDINVPVSDLIAPECPTCAAIAKIYSTTPQRVYREIETIFTIAEQAKREGREAMRNNPYDSARNNRQVHEGQGTRRARRIRRERER